MKKKIMMGTGIGIGAIMLLASGLSASAGGSGYEVYKAAWKQTHTVTSMAGEASLQLSDNGTSLLNASTSFKGDIANHAASASVQFTAGQASKSLNVYHHDGQTVLKHSDQEVYQVIEHEGNEEEMAEHGAMHNGNHAELVENVFDTLVGQLRHQVTLAEDENGGQLVSLHLNSAQISAPVQAISSLLITAAAGEEEWKPEAGPAEGMDIELPDLVEEVRITAINLDAVIDEENYISNQRAAIEVTGKDAQGKTHELVLDLELDLTDREHVAPDTVDLTGKKVELVNPEEFGHEGPKK
ncbi:VIT1/CCC1 family predicted Fe2+/Mn2+ transporter [Paenibacillus phyllosphaerae]|uniref:VIT1/CCC1 family predicted Fe2+/Mn2+ transporter n=1 Tax=Paenibacillus phyllosphaerae TaxID=274593 RepID=A0A7W5FMJ8_9BACL|nr:hypothetical protein [Paenibacillus phyllosphaerae]MBB3110157.1 VIT1/CCC1 family predicted Fe2+/Mn2+ transporter [Paenibacillus phyllosphaerae]